MFHVEHRASAGPGSLSERSVRSAIRGVAASLRRRVYIIVIVCGVFPPSAPSPPRARRPERECQGCFT